MPCLFSSSPSSNSDYDADHCPCAICISSDFSIIQEAYETLIDPSSRMSFDSWLEKRGLSSSSTHQSVVISAEVDVSEMIWDEDLQKWTFACRCGESFWVSELNSAVQLFFLLLLSY